MWVGKIEVKLEIKRKKDPELKASLGKAKPLGSLRI
jgi:hypothetical protein